MKLFRASQVYKLIGSPKAKGELLTETAKGTIREIAKQDIFGFSAFLGNKYTEKGILLEDMAIEHSGLIRDRFYTKHTGRLSNDYITGECDVLDKDNNLIIDTKCSWDFGSHPCFKDEAIEKVKKAGYDVQMQCYMWLYDVGYADIDFWLFPCPRELLTRFDDDYQLIDLVEQTDIKDRVTTVTIARDDKVIERIKEVIPHAQAYYDVLCEQFTTEILF